MHAHSRYTFAHQLTVTKIAVLGRLGTVNNSGATIVVFQPIKPSVEFLGALEGDHLTIVSKRILTCDPKRRQVSMGIRLSIKYKILNKTYTYEISAASIPANRPNTAPFKTEVAPV